MGDSLEIGGEVIFYCVAQAACPISSGSLLRNASTEAYATIRTRGGVRYGYEFRKLGILRGADYSLHFNPPLLPPCNCRGEI